MLRETWRWVLGMIYVLAVALIWIVASFVVQSVVEGGISPFLITYICNSLFVIYIPIVELGRLLEPRARKTWAQHANRLKRTSQLQVQGPEKEKLLEDEDLKRSGTVVQSTGEETLLEVPISLGSPSALQIVNGVDEKFSQEERSGTGVTDDCGSGDDKQSVVEREGQSEAEEKMRLWTRKEIAWIGLLICPFWFLAQFTFNLSLKYTSVTSNTILSSASSLFTFLMSILFLKEKFTWLKLGSVLLCMAGTIVVSLADSEGTDDVAKGPVWGDILCIVSGIFYASYTTLIRKKLPDEAKGEGRASTALFFGFLGLFNALLFLPVALILHFTNIEPFHRLTLMQVGLIVGKGLFDNVLSDYLWAKAVLLTTTTAATTGLTIQIPIAAIVDSIRGVKIHLLDIVGGIGVLVGFIGINHPATGCCCSAEEYNGDSEEVFDGNAGKEVDSGHV